MKTIKTTVGMGIALVLATAIGSVSAEEADLTRAQDRERTELNQKTYENEQVQEQNRNEYMKQNAEKKMEQHKYQIENERDHSERYQSEQRGNAAGAEVRQNMMNQTIRSRR